MGIAAHKGIACFFLGGVGAVVLARTLWAAHFSGSQERGPRKHLPNIAGVSNSALGLAARVGEPTLRRTCSSPRGSVRLARDHRRQI